MFYITALKWEIYGRMFMISLLGSIVTYEFTLTPEEGMLPLICLRRVLPASVEYIYLQKRITPQSRFSLKASCQLLRMTCT